MNYFSTKEKLPEINEDVIVFFENCAYGSHGTWWTGKRASETHFELGIDFKLKAKIDGLDHSEYLCCTATYWAYENCGALPNLCRIHEHGNAGCV